MSANIHKSDILICRSTLKIFKWSLIWPNRKSEMNSGKWYYLKIAIFVLITSGWVLSVLLHLFIGLKNNLDISLSEDFAFFFAFCGCYYMLAIYVKNQPKIALLLRDMSYFSFGKPPNYEESVSKLTYWSIFFYTYTVGAIVFYNFIKILTRKDCERINVEKKLNENCGFLSPTWFPFDIGYSPLFELMMFYVFLSAQLLMKVGLMVSFNCLEMVQHIIIRIKHLNEMIIDCFGSEDLGIMEKKFTVCVQYHLEILGFAKRLDECFSQIMFAHLTITAAICGCLEKQYIDAKEDTDKLTASVHVLGWVMALFVACAAGQNLINASGTIPGAIWRSKWYEAHVGLGKNLRFMMARSQKDLHVTAGSFGVLSYSLFVSVMKMSYSILAMLKRA